MYYILFEVILGKENNYQKKISFPLPTPSFPFSVPQTEYLKRKPNDPITSRKKSQTNILMKFL